MAIKNNENFKPGHRKRQAIQTLQYNCSLFCQPDFRRSSRKK